MVGRTMERKKLLEAFESGHSEFVVVYGRRLQGIWTTWRNAGSSVATGSLDPMSKGRCTV
jgi:hypothetical protein